MATKTLNIRILTTLNPSKELALYADPKYMQIIKFNSVCLIRKFV